MSSYRKTIKGDHNQANEQFSGNRIYNDWGHAGEILAGMVVVIVLIAVVFMMTHDGALLGNLTTITIVGAFACAWIVGIYFVKGYVSNKQRQIQTDKSAVHWEDDVLYTDNMIASRKPDISFHNAQQITHNHHHNAVQISEVAEYDGDIEPMPPIQMRQR